MAKKMDAGQTQTLKKVLRYMKPVSYTHLSRRKSARNPKNCGKNL